MRLRKPGLTHRFLVLGLGAAAPAALVLGLLVPGMVRATVAPASSSVTDYVTFYGWVDNSPAGPAIAHPCIHNQAGGTGTFSDPVTFAEHIDLHAKVILNPPSNEPVDTTPMFTPPTTCHGGSGDARASHRPAR